MCTYSACVSSAAIFGSLPGTGGSLAAAGPPPSPPASWVTSRACEVTSTLISSTYTLAALSPFEWDSTGCDPPIRHHIVLVHNLCITVPLDNFGSIISRDTYKLRLLPSSLLARVYCRTPYLILSRKQFSTTTPRIGYKENYEEDPAIPSKKQNGTFDCHNGVPMDSADSLDARAKGVCNKAPERSHAESDCVAFRTTANLFALQGQMTPDFDGIKTTKVGNVGCRFAFVPSKFRTFSRIIVAAWYLSPKIIVGVTIALWDVFVQKK